MALPTCSIEEQEDKTIVSFVFTNAQLAELEAELEEENADALRRDYCCTCTSNGARHAIRASNSFSASFKCLKKCIGSFQLSKGKC